MDVILSRAGISGDQQRALCFGAVRDEVQRAEAKLADALAALRQALEVARVAQNVNKSSSPLSVVAPEVKTPVMKMQSAGKEIHRLLQKLHSGLHATNTVVALDSESSTDEEERTTTSDQAPAPAFPAQGIKTERPAGLASMLAFRSRSSAEMASRNGVDAVTPSRASRENTSNGEFSDADEVDVWGRERKRQAIEQEGLRVAAQPVERVTKANAATELGKRLALLPPGHLGLLFTATLKAAVEVAQLEIVTGGEPCIQRAVDTTREAISTLILQCRSLPDRGMQRFEDIRQVLMVVVRAVQKTKGHLEASELRDLLSLISRLQEKFPASAARTRWCNTTLRNFITATYKKPAKVATADQDILTSTLAEVRGWKYRDSYSVSKFEHVMSTIRMLLESTYEGWEPREDTRLAELIGLMNIRVGAFGVSAVQEGRQREVKSWRSKMSGSSFALTLDLESIPPRELTEVYTEANGGFHSVDDIEANFKRIAHLKSTKHFGLTTTALFTLLATMILTRDQSLIPLRTLRRFNENVQELKYCDPAYDELILQVNQELEKMLYLMRVVMHKRPEYKEYSTSTIETLLSFFPSSCRPTFVFPQSISTSDSSAVTPIDTKLNDTKPIEDKSSSD
ncbi:hypothetical protein PHYBOEH_009756 [Phytophthora boehmeriae]|uniref:Uncharacterized protein n=1 Tax=Phytophthora boehmeriae TaxID=109152 RepID=A0A8T1VUC1_9STRA|nr:hypothetical protein PHYBOEH_009756 [Phytophthora boehmeriae]